MKLARRDCLRWGLMTGAGGLLSSGCSRVVTRYTAPPPPRSVALPRERVLPTTRLLNRVAYGPTPGEVERVAALGAERYVEEQLRAEGEEETRTRVRLRAFDAPRESASELRDLPESAVLRHLQQATLLRAVYSRHQLRERMADFWGNHFNVYARKGRGAYFKPVDELRVVREHALGTFPALLRASARSPAMLAYLDNDVNQRGVANENYARELMELHTLGVDGGYTQKDVQEVARCLTGWTVEDRFLRRRGTFRFEPSRHDQGPKTVLGVRIPPGGGEHDGGRVLEILAAHPSTARFIAGKVCRYFLGDGDPARTWTPRLAAIYTRTNGDIKVMLRPLLLSDDLLAAPPVLKRPFDFVVSSLRALNADTDGGQALQDHLFRMGQPLYQWPLPDGYPDGTAAWTGSLLARWNFAFALLSGGIGGTRADADGLLKVSGADGAAARADAILEIVLARPAQDEAIRSLRTAVRSHMAAGGGGSGLAAEAAALCLAAPPFQWR